MSKQLQQRVRFLLAASVLAGSFAVGSVAQAQGAGPLVFPTDVENIALAKNGGRVVAATSTLDNDPTLNPNNLIDGQVTSAGKPNASAGWASNRFDPIDMESVTLGFKGDAIRRIGKVVINPVANVTPERWAKDVEIQVATESPEGPFRPVTFATLRKAAVPQEFKFVPADAKYLRLVFRSNWGSERSVALGEVEVYEAIGNTDPIGQIIWKFQGAVDELKRFRQTQFGSSGAGVTTASASPLSEATLQLIQSTGGAKAGAGAAAGAALAGGRVASPNVASSANGGYIADFSSQILADDPTKGPDPAFAPKNLLDGQVLKPDGTGTNGWASQGFAPGKQFVTIGFKEDRVRLLSKIVLNPASGQSDLRWARRIDVQVTTESAKAGPYRTVSTVTLRPEPINQEFNFGPVEAKYVRLVFQANGPGNIPLLTTADPDVNSDRSVSLGEVEMYEATAGSQQLDTLIDSFQNVLLELQNLRRAGKAPVANAATTASEPKSAAQKS